MADLLFDWLDSAKQANLLLTCTKELHAFVSFLTIMCY